MVIPVSTCMGTWTVPKGITDILNLEQAPLASYSIYSIHSKNRAWGKGVMGLRNIEHLLVSLHLSSYLIFRKVGIVKLVLLGTFYRWSNGFEKVY